MHFEYFWTEHIAETYHRKYILNNKMENLTYWSKMKLNIKLSGK